MCGHDDNTGENGIAKKAERFENFDSLFAEEGEGVWAFWGRTGGFRDDDLSPWKNGWEV